MGNVVVTIRGPEPSPAERAIDLGEFHAVWVPGVTIGSDPNCTVVLPELPPLAARLTAASSHKFLARFEQGRLAGSRRVDHSEFLLGPYQIRFDTADEAELLLAALAVVDPRAALWSTCACLRRVLLWNQAGAPRRLDGF